MILFTNKCESVVHIFIIFRWCFLDVPINTVDLTNRRPSIQSFQDFRPEEGLLEVLRNPTSVISNDHAVIGNVIDSDLKAENINYELYTKDNKEQSVSLRVGDTVQLKKSPFNSTWPTKILIHGWIESGSTIWLQNIRQNYLSVGDYNVICVDWSAASTKEYLISVKLIRQVNDFAYLTKKINMTDQLIKRIFKNYKFSLIFEIKFLMMLYT